MNDRSQGAFWATAVAVLAYGVAMGYLEAAVVVYLRAALGLGPAGVALTHDPAAFGTYGAVEVARELATLVMIAAVGWLAGRGGLERLAWAAVAFGAWDIVYYLGLRLVTGWPPSLNAWDILFLVPVPWVGPVWAPIVLSAALVSFGLAAARRVRADQPIRVGPVRAIAALVSAGLIIGSFLVDADRLRAGDVPTWSGWPLFGVGMLLGTAAAATALAAARSTTGVPGGVRVRNGTSDRPSVDSPDMPTPPQQEVTNMSDTVKDPVCGMEIRPEDVAATEDHEGRTFHFCSEACHETFVNDPHRYGHPKEEPGHAHG